jgi:hypothetical protein
MFSIKNANSHNSSLQAKVFAQDIAVMATVLAAIKEANKGHLGKISKGFRNQRHFLNVSSRHRNLAR